MLDAVLEELDTGGALAEQLLLAMCLPPLNGKSTAAAA